MKIVVIVWLDCHPALRLFLESDASERVNPSDAVPAERSGPANRTQEERIPP